MKLSGLTKMVKRQLVCNVFHNDESDDFYIGTASAIYCATGFPRPLNRNQMGAMLGISEDTMIEKVVYNDFDCAYKIDFQGFNLDDTIKDEVEVKKLGIGIYCSGEILIPLVTEDRHMVGIICQSHLAPLEDEIKNNGFIRYYQRKQTDGTVYYVVKNGMRVRAAVMAYTVPDYAEAKLQELVAMLAKDIWTKMPFRDGDDPECPNDLRRSDVMKYLGNCLAEFTERGTPLDTFIPFKIDLQDTTGQTEYGTVEYRIGLLTLRQYGKYWRLIPKVDTPWWLATPYGTPNCSPSANSGSNVWSVKSDGSGGSWRYNGTYGVRPALYFPSTLWVSTEDEGEAGFCLADVPLDDLLAEIKSRAEE